MNLDAIRTFRILMKITGIHLAWVLLILAAIPLSVGCEKNNVPEQPQDSSDLYVLPDAHSDNNHPLKNQFFQEPFIDLMGNELTLDSLRGIPLVIVMFPSFLTNDGKFSLMGMEALMKGRLGQFQAVFIPREDADTIRPTIMSEPKGMLFLFRQDGSDNYSLIDQYSGFFWNEGLISADFPLDSTERHLTSPFYWIVDSNGTIREKLIDYSDSTGVDILELETVLNALLGPPEVIETTEPESSVSVTEPDELMPSEISGDESAGANEISASGNVEESLE